MNKIIGNIVSYPIPITELTNIIHKDVSLARQYAEGLKYPSGDQVVSGEEGYEANASYYANELRTALDAIDSKVDDAYVDEEDHALVLTANGEVVARLTGIAGSGSGGGGGSTSDIKFKANNTSGWVSTTVAKGSSCPIKFSWSSIEDEVATGAGTVSIKVNNVTKLTRSIEQGEVTIDIGSYLSTGANTVRVNVSDSYSNSRIINYTISVIELILTSNFNDSIAYTGSVTFPYTPNANLAKTVHFLLNGVEVGTENINTNGQQQTKVFTNLSHGSYNLEVYFTATLDKVLMTSNHLRYSFVFYEEGNNTPIVACTPSTDTIVQYNNALFKYLVYTPNSLTSEVELSVDGTVINTVTVNRSRQTWTYRGDSTGTRTLKIQSGSVYREYELTVTPSSITVNPVTNNLALYLTAYNRSNSEAHPDTWTYDGIEATFSGFNWSSDGWQKDKNNVDVLRLQSNARVEIPYLPFEGDARTLGKTIEIEFSTSNVMDYNTVLLSCLDEGRGFRITAQEAYLASEQTTIGTQFKEDEHVRISFVVSQQSTERLIYCYINGVISGIAAYASDDDFQQNEPVGISIGSSFCTIDIYNIRIYDTSLTHRQIINNWIADMQDGSTIVSTYIDNDIYDDYGNITTAKLPNYLPYLILEGPELPESKGDKKTISGQYFNPLDESKNFTFTGAEIDVQGTSSQYYPRKNYKIKFKKGITMTATDTHEEAYALSSNSIPVSTFCFKADYASSEGANNVELVRYYDDICPYRTPPQDEENGGDPRVRQGIDGYPMVIFYNDGNSISFVGKYNFNNDKSTETTFGFTEGDQSWETLNNTSAKVLWKDDDYSTYAKWKDDYEARFPDVKDKANTSDLAALATWLKSTDTGTIITIVDDERVDTGIPVWADQTQTETDPVTGDPIYHGYALSPAVTIDDVEYTEDNEEYRLAKFKSEFEDHLDLESTTFYYVFTEVFLMVDSRAKNSFPTKFNGKTWCWLPYDMDTAIGINNEGRLAFSYSLEDIDLVDGSYVYNGQNSVIWSNFRKCFYDEIVSMYKELRSNEDPNKVLSYDAIERRFEEHQNKWPASIFNEDAYFKYIQPANPDYYGMCLGSKAEQRKWWLFNRFRYLDSKYSTGDSSKNYIVFRAYQPGSFSITPYADIYVRVKCGSYEAQVRGQKGIASDINVEIYDANDTETMIYSADQIKDAGNLYVFRPGYCDISMATKLQSLRIGGNARNQNFTSLTLGNNVLLKYLDIRNCPNLATNVDASKCISLEEAYFEGTSITSLSLPDGGILNTLHLPATITNLTIKNQPYLTDLQIAGYTRLTTLVLENPNSEIQDLAVTIISEMKNGSRVRIMGLNLSFTGGSEVDSFIKKLSKLRGIDINGNNTPTPQLGGNCHISQATPAQVEALEGYGLNVTYDQFVMYVYFYDESGTQLLDTRVTSTGVVGYQGLPQSKTQDAQYTYLFSGWSLTPGGAAVSGILNNITDTCNLYAAFSGMIRSYTVKFLNGSETLDGYYLPYGSIPVYSGPTPTYNGSEPDDYDEFIGWLPELAPVTGNVDYQANFRFIGLWTRKYINQTLTNVESDNVTKLTDYAFYYQQKLVSVSFPNVLEAGSQVFYYCDNLVSINLPSLKTIDKGPYGYPYSTYPFICLNNSSNSGNVSSGLRYINFDNLESIDCTLIQSYKSNLTEINLPKLRFYTLFSSDPLLGMYYTNVLKRVSLPNLLVSGSILSISNPSGSSSSIVNEFEYLEIPKLEFLTNTLLNIPNSKINKIELPNLIYSPTSNLITTSSVARISTVDIGESFDALRPTSTSGSSSSSESLFAKMSYLTTIILRSTTVINLKSSVNNSSYGLLYNTPFTGNQTNASPDGIYVPHYLVDEYKSSTNWTLVSSYIKPIYDIESVTDLSITANNVSGRFSTTTIHVHLEGYGSYLGVESEDLIILDYDVRSDDFGVNTSSSPRQITISYEYGSETASTTIIQSGIIANTIVLDNVIKQFKCYHGYGRVSNAYWNKSSNSYYAIFMTYGSWVISDELVDGYTILETNTYSEYLNNPIGSSSGAFTTNKLHCFDMTNSTLRLKFQNCYGSIDKISRWRATGISYRASSQYDEDPSFKRYNTDYMALSDYSSSNPDGYSFNAINNSEGAYKDEFDPEIAGYNGLTINTNTYKSINLFDIVRFEGINAGSSKKSYVAISSDINIEYREVDTRNG